MRDALPNDGSIFYMRQIVGPYRWKAYKPEGQKQMGVSGRWQIANEFGGWDNCEKPDGEFLSKKEADEAFRSSGVSL